MYFRTLQTQRRTCDHALVHKGRTHQNISIGRDAIAREYFQHIPTLYQVEGDQLGHLGGVIIVIIGSVVDVISGYCGGFGR